MLRIYTAAPLALSQIQETLNGLSIPITDEEIPVWISPARLEISNLISLESDFIVNDPASGAPVFKTKTVSKDIPLSTYFIIASPHMIDGKSIGEDETIRRLNRAEALLTTYLGSTAVYKLIHEAIHPAKLGEGYKVYGEVVSTIQQCDAPYFSEENWAQINKTNIHIEALNDADKKARIKRSLEFLQSGKSAKDYGQEEKFFFYWTAITVLCDERTMEINKRLQRIYGFSKEEVENKLH